MNAQSKPKVLVLVRYFLPGYRSGGPVRSISNLLAYMAKEIDFTVHCLDRDHLDKQSYSRESRLAAQDCGGRVQYLRPRELWPWRIARRMRREPCDVVYLNSLFDPLFTLAPLLAMRLNRNARAPCVLSPRGELSDGALSIKSRRKRAFLWLARRLRLYEGVIFRASSPAEAGDIRRQLPFVAPDDVMIASEFPAPPRPAASVDTEKQAGALRVVFIGRIARMKNLAHAVAVVNELQGAIDFDIYGPMDDSSYWTECEAFIDSAPPNVRVRYCGEIPHEAVAATLGRYHVFLLPTLGENFGHAIFEALIRGLPVVLSDRTQWRDLAAQGIGYDIALEDRAAYVRALAHYSDMTFEDYASVRRRVREFALDWIESQRLVDQSRAIFRRSAELGRARSSGLAAGAICHQITPRSEQ
jgi:glycosyltransferase involved in cell wall biosynthesis